MAVTDSTVPGGGYAFYREVDSEFGTTGSGTIVPGGGSVTIDMLLRFRHPVDWSGIEGAGKGGRTQLFNFGGFEINFARDNINVNGGGGQAIFELNAGAVASWGTLGDGQWHHLAVVVAPVNSTLSARLWIDGESPDEFLEPLGGSLAALTQVRPGCCYKSKGIDVDELSIYAQALPPTMIAQRSREGRAGTRASDADRCEARQCTRLVRDGGFVPELYEPGFSPTAPYAPSVSTLDQIITSPLPRYDRGHTMPRLSSLWMESPYNAAPADPVTYTHPDKADAGPRATQREVDTLRVPQMRALATDFNYAVSGKISGDSAAYPLLNPYTQFIRTMPANWPIELLVGESAEGNAGVPIVNASSATIGLSPASPTGPFQTLGGAWAPELHDREVLFQRKVDLVTFDVEGTSGSTYQHVGTSMWDSVKTLPGNAATETWCTSTRGLPWRQCLASGITGLRNAYRTGAFANMVQRPAAHFYGISGNEFYDGDFQYTRLQNEPIPSSYDPQSNGSDRYRYSTPYVYPLNPNRWYPTINDRRGLNWFFADRDTEIAAGSPWAQAYVAAGWSYDETKNIRPPQWLGLLKLMSAAGALTMIPATFVIPSGPGAMCSWGVCNDAPCALNDSVCRAQTIQNPNHQVWQTIIPPFAQAALSKAEDILRSPSAVWLGELPVSTPAAPATGYRLGTRVVIATAFMPSGNNAAFYQQASVPVTIGIDHDGNAGTAARNVTVEARLQGSVYLIDFGTTPETVLQQDAWHSWLHPTRWGTDLLLDVEAADATTDVTLKSEAPAAASGNHLSSVGYLSVVPARATQTFTPGAAAPQVEFDLEPRATGAFTVWVRARSRTTSGSAFVWQDTDTAGAASTGCISGTSWRWVRLDCSRSSAAAALTFTGAQKRTIHIAPSHGGIEIDRVLLSKQTTCLEAAPNCSCAP